MKSHLLFLACLVPLLVACQTMDKMGNSISNMDMPSFDIGRDGRTTVMQNGDCPSVARVAELSSLYQFTNPSRPDANELISQAHISAVNSVCRKQNKTLQLALKIDFGSVLGPKGRIHPGDKPNFAYPYFVAVTNAQNQILAKEIHAVPFGYDADDTQMLQTETITQMVPLAGDDPKTYRILVGFQLAPEEVTYNRTLPETELGKNLSVLTVVPQ